jgi:lipopolysaccharide transport system ATP-binding protein
VIASFVDVVTNAAQDAGLPPDGGLSNSQLVGLSLLFLLALVAAAVLAVRAAARRSAHQADLPQGTVIAVEEVTKAPPLPLPQPPRWLARILPGVEMTSSTRDDTGGDPEDDDDDLDDFDPDERASVAFKPFTFEVPAGGGIGLVGPDFEVTQSLLAIIAGFQPPSTGRILVRGRVAPLLKPNVLNISKQNTGRKAVAVLGAFLGWPLDLLKDEKWEQIVEFAHLEELTEFEPGTLEYKQQATRRLLQSAVLHLDDVGVYLVGYNFNRAYPEFEERCLEVIRQRQRAGCAVIQNGVEVEDVSRFCNEAIWVEAGKPLFRGRLGEVAKFAHERATSEEETKPLQLRALLSGDEEEVEVGPRGGRIEIELDVFSRKRLELALALQLTDDAGRQTRLEQPRSVIMPKPGVYRLRVDVPGGTLGDSNYKGVLLASGVNGRSEAEQSLLAFDLVSRSFGTSGSSTDLEPDLAFPGDDTGEGAGEPDEVTWSVRRLTT